MVRIDFINSQNIKIYSNKVTDEKLLPALNCLQIDDLYNADGYKYKVINIFHDDQAILHIEVTTAPQPEEACSIMY